MYDVLIVGSGLFGAVFARQCLDAGKSVLVLERREHIAGNCYTKQVDGITQHIYGPHIFHTNSPKIWDYVRRYASFNNYVNRPKVLYKNQLFSFPINLFTLYQLWGVKTPDEARQKLDSVRLSIAEPKNLEEWALSQVGEELYQTFIYGYTKKQWMREPRELPASIIKRLPIRLNFDDNYFNDAYQGIPDGGYTKLIQNMLYSATVELGVDYLATRDKWDAMAKTVVFTGCLDQFYDYKFGKLEYRTLRFETQRAEIEDYQGNAVVNYTEAEVPFTRVVEHKHFANTKTAHTLVTREFPEIWTPASVPYYPIGDEQNSAVYTRYAARAKAETKYIFGGRLAEYRYYDMHQVIGSALTATAAFLEGRK